MKITSSEFKRYTEMTKTKICQKESGWINAGATQTETSLLKPYVAGKCVDLLDDKKKVFHSALALLRKGSCT